VASCRVLERVRLDSQPRIPFNLEKQGGESTSQELMLFLPILWGMLPRASLSKGATDPAFGPFLAKHTEFRKLEPP